MNSLKSLFITTTSAIVINFSVPITSEAADNLVLVCQVSAVSESGGGFLTQGRYSVGLSKGQVFELSSSELQLSTDNRTLNAIYNRVNLTIDRRDGSFSGYSDGGSANGACQVKTEKLKF